MLNLGIIGFAQPWLLLALAGLPVLWLLLRVTPPSPRRQAFPAIRLVSGLKAPEETPARTPWWLLLLRMLVAALIILGLSQPLLNPSRGLTGSGPLVLVIDDGWTAARFWSARLSAMERLLGQADREARPVILLTTAPTARGEVPEPSPELPATEAQRLAQALKPKPWPVNRFAVLDCAWRAPPTWCGCPTASTTWFKLRAGPAPWLLPRRSGASAVWIFCGTAGPAWPG
jgi:hypothetical protein